jgi:hypothetical protein
MQAFRDILFGRIANGRWHTKDIESVYQAFESACLTGEPITSETHFLAKLAGVYWMLVNQENLLADENLPLAVRAFFTSIMGHPNNKGSWSTDQIFAYPNLPPELGFYLLNTVDDSSDAAKNYVARQTIAGQLILGELAKISNIRFCL